MAVESNSISIRNLTRRAIPGVAFEAVKNKVLGEKYDLSLAFVGDKRMRNWNKNLRGKDKTTNILSFPLTKTEGEIFINLRLVPDDETALMLFIHGLHHLKGYEHGTIMEQKEAECLSSCVSALTKAHGKNQRDNRNRCGHLSRARGCC